MSICHCRTWALINSSDKISICQNDLYNEASVKKALLIMVACLAATLAAACGGGSSGGGSNFNVTVSGS